MPLKPVGGKKKNASRPKSEKKRRSYKRKDSCRPVRYEALSLHAQARETDVRTLDASLSLFQKLQDKRKITNPMTPCQSEWSQIKEVSRVVALQGGITSKLLKPKGLKTQNSLIWHKQNLQQSRKKSTIRPSILSAPNTATISANFAPSLTSTPIS